MKSLAVFAAALSAAATFAGAGGAVPPPWKNCAAVNARYPHGIGRANAHDKTKSGNNPVTNFKRSTSLYNTAMRYNRGLDRDKDGIACEQP